MIEFHYIFNSKHLYGVEYIVDAEEIITKWICVLVGLLEKSTVQFRIDIFYVGILYVLIVILNEDIVIIFSWHSVLFL